jgi:hypothetical protein
MRFRLINYLENYDLVRGCDPRAYSEYLIDVARSIKLSGVRLNIAGLAMPGSSLGRRIHRILESGSLPQISRSRMACVFMACVISCTAIAAGTLDHAQSHPSTEHVLARSDPATSAQPAKFTLGDLNLEGDISDRDGVTDRVLKATKSREYENQEQLTDEVGERIRADFQERGYFQAVVHTSSLQPLELTDGKQSLRVIASVNAGDQFRLRSINIQSAAPDQRLSISLETLRDQFHLRDGDVFNATEIRQGLGRLRKLYLSSGYVGETAIPDTEIVSASRQIDLNILITERPHKP